MNQKYQKVFAGEKAIKKRLFRLFIVQGSKVGSSTNKQGAVPNGAEPPVILRPEEPCVLPSQQEATLGMWARYSWAVWQQFGWQFPSTFPCNWINIHGDRLPDTGKWNSRERTLPFIWQYEGLNCHPIPHLPSLLRVCSLEEIRWRRQAWEQLKPSHLADSRQPSTPSDRQLGLLS